MDVEEILKVIDHASGQPLRLGNSCLRFPSFEHGSGPLFREWGATPSPCVVTHCAHRLDIYGPVRQSRTRHYHLVGIEGQRRDNPRQGT